MLRGLIALSLILSLSACDSRLNPLNWFGGDREERIRIDPEVGVEDALNELRPLVAEVTQLSVEQTTSGAIVRATAVAPLQGFWDVDLREVERTPTTLVYEFRAAPPEGNAQAGVQQIVAGVSLSVGDLQGIRTITVIAQNNRRSVTRR